MDIKKLISQMTLEEKAGLCSGSDFWHTKAVERLGIPSVMLSDGPHGLRKQADAADHLGLNESITAICFPAGCAMASSYDPSLIQSIGEALGDECQAEDLSVILGPAACIKRSPLCGRNFEYFSEDPFLSTEIATGHIKGVQSKNIGTSLKHYLANSQEHRRMTSSSNMDERTMREIYLATFEGAVKNAQPWTVMCSYNKINGTYACENEEALTKVLRDEWGYNGYVVSDWGATNDRVASLKAGLELEMPASGGVNDAKIVAAVKDGSLDEAILDRAVERILNIEYKYLENRKPETKFDYVGHDALARKAAGECAVLLKNEDVLPLNKKDKVAFIGKYAQKPRYQGGGSSHINPYHVTGAIEAAADLDVVYAQGYDDVADVIDEAMIAEAVEAAKNSNAAVIFAGLPDAFESEGYDRTHMNMPNCQNALIEAVAKVQPNTIIVLHNGSPVEMPWIDDVKAVLEVYLGGEAVGGAAVDILFGDVNPSGKLAETFPLRLEDNPSYLYYVGEGDVVEYREGVFVGYRYYDKKLMEVLFPFGHGLSYTTFEYASLKLSSASIKDTDTLTVSVDVTNTGNMAGKEVVQLYVGAQSNNEVIRPIKELRGFDKVELAPGETKTVTFTLDKRAFAYWNMQIHDWYVPTGDYEILIGASSRDLRCQADIHVDTTRALPKFFTINSTFGDVMADPIAAKYFGPIAGAFTLGDELDSDAEESPVSKEMMAAMFANMPLRALLSFSGGAISEKMITGALDQANAQQ